MIDIVIIDFLVVVVVKIEMLQESGGKMLWVDICYGVVLVV